MTDLLRRSRTRGSMGITCVVCLLTLCPGTSTAQSLPAPWASADVGRPAIHGSSSYPDGAFRVNAAGSDISSTADQFHFVYRWLIGDGAIVARVDDLQFTDGWAKAGVMIRASLAANSPHVLAAITPDHGVAFQRRRVAGGASVHTDGGAGHAPVWLRIERRGKTLTAYRSTDAATWQEIGTEIIAMTGAVYAGLAVTSRSPSVATTASFREVALQQLNALPDSPIAAAGWSSADIGNPTQAGSERQNGDVFTVNGGGAGVGGTSDDFHYLYKQVSGDADIVARVKAVEYIRAGSRGGLMVRDSLAADAAHGSMMLRAGTGTLFQRRSAPGGTTSATSVGGLEPYWLALRVRDGVVTAFQSGDGNTWETAGSVTLALPSPFYIGLAVTSDGDTASAAAMFDNVFVSAGSQNQPPIVSLTVPANGATLTSPANTVVTANASDADGSIARVDFFANGTLIGSATASPYSVSWSNVTAGSYALSAVAQDDAGAAATSAVVLVTVATNQLNAVSPASPAAGTSVMSSTDAMVAAAAALPTDWTSIDIGGPTAAGSADYSNGTFTIAGAGGVWRSPDRFRYTYQAFTGDVTITSRVVSQTNTQEWAKAGVMIRETLSADARHTSLVATPGHGTVFFFRATTGQPPPQEPVTVGTGLPAWVRLERRGSVVTAFYSSNGTAWTAAGSTTLATATMYVGLAVSSEISGTRSTAVFDNVSVTGSTSNQPPTVSLTAPANGATFTAPATITVSANASDSDGTIAKVDFFAGAALIGTDTTSPYSISWSNVAAGTYSLTAVATDNASATTTSAARSVTVTPAANQAPTVSLTAPANGATFTEPATITVSANASDIDGTIAKVDFFAGTTLIGTDTTSPYSISWSSVAAGTYSLTAVATDNAGAPTTSAARSITVTQVAPLPPPWTSIDIGGPAAAGSMENSNGTFTIAGAGGVWRSPDRFRYTYQAFTGDITITSHVVSQTNTQEWAKAGVMIRETLSADARHTSLVATPGHGTVFFFRATTGQPPPQEPVTVGTGLPAWVRLERRGSVVTAFYSSNGTAWTAAGSTTLATATMYVGLAVSSEISGTRSTAVFDNVSVTAPTSNQPPAVSPTAPANGATFTAPATITVSANASDSDGTIAKVDFFAGTTLIGSDTTSPFSISWSNVAAGTYSLTAVATDNAGATTPSAARSVTVTPAANQAPTVSLTAPANGATFTAPATITVSANASDSDGTIAKVDFFAGTTLIGSDTTSPFSISWSNVAAGTYSLTAVATDNAGATTPSAARSVTVTPAANQAPTVSLTAPANGATFTAPATITVSANASDSDGTIAKVDFFAGTTLIGSDTTSPFSISWSNVAAGTYSLTAVATDNAGATTPSAARSVTVTPAANQAPTVSLTAPANGATFTAPATITVSANASDSDGTIAKVDFFAGTTLIGTDSTSPYSINWSNVGAGTYSLTAVATDNGAATRTSAAVSVTVSNPTSPVRRAQFTASADHATLVGRYVLEVFAAGANPNTATPLASQDLGKPPVVNGGCDVDISQTVNALAPGSYQATVSAAGTGGSSRSAPASFTK